MKKLLFIAPLVFNSCMTQSDYINVVVAGTAFTVATHVEEWHLNHEAKRDSIRQIKNEK